MNLAIDHINGHLSQPLRLTDLAEVAELSPFHFHRIFQMLAGATPQDFVKRLRLERALSLICTTKRLSITRIALQCGFASSSDFSRSFKQRYGASPSSFDTAAWKRTHRGELESLMRRPSGGSAVTSLPAAANPDGFSVRIRDLPPRTLASIRVPNPYQGTNVTDAAGRLLEWARRHSAERAQWLGYQWDNPEIASLEDCQYHVAVEADLTRSRGEISRVRFPAMVVAQVTIRGSIELELRALQWLYGTWLPRSGYVPDDYPCFEAWIGLPFAHGTQHFELHVQLPIKKW
ncbi:MAG: helix-turn-helix domain-containing protein [Planctomycetota bacterium]|nr:helix-turn-helix domain-containing protein [Planctomycetota bacterium]